MLVLALVCALSLACPLVCDLSLALALVCALALVLAQERDQVLERVLAWHLSKSPCTYRPSPGMLPNHMVVFHLARIFLRRSSAIS